MSFQRVVVLCQAGSVTGGPEVIHQLVHRLCMIGVDASVCYFPFGADHRVPDAYRHYDTPVSTLRDDAATLFIVPESATWLTRLVRHGTAAIWWLSVDNYIGAKHESKLKDWITALRLLRRSRVPLWLLKRKLHFVQSAYAREFLAKSRIDSMPLTDYLNSSHRVANDVDSLRENAVAFNPSKGKARTRRLIESNSGINFIPLQGMTPTEVASTLRRVKIYIDFGHHPGKDRLPREAAVAGCCVVTNRRGSAAFAEDVSIPDRYKLADDTDEYLVRFKSLATSVFDDFAEHSAEFDNYRRTIAREKSLFDRQVEAIFLGHLRLPTGASMRCSASSQQSV